MVLGVGMVLVGFLAYTKNSKIMTYCEDCGCKVFSGACVNCHEEVYIAEQYYELEMPVPDTIADKVAEHEPQIVKNLEKDKRKR